MPEKSMSKGCVKRPSVYRLGGPGIVESRIRCREGVHSEQISNFTAQLALVPGSLLWRNFYTQKLWRAVRWAGLRKGNIHILTWVPCPPGSQNISSKIFKLLHLPYPARLENGLLLLEETEWPQGKIFQLHGFWGLPMWRPAWLPIPPLINKPRACTWSHSPVTIQCSGPPEPMLWTTSLHVALMHVHGSTSKALASKPWLHRRSESASTHL